MCNSSWWSKLDSLAGLLYNRRVLVETPLCHWIISFLHPSQLCSAASKSSFDLNSVTNCLASCQPVTRSQSALVPIKPPNRSFFFFLKVGEHLLHCNKSPAAHILEIANTILFTHFRSKLVQHQQIMNGSTSTILFACIINKDWRY